MPKNRKGSSWCWVCGHVASQHAHDMGSNDNKGVDTLGHCRVQMCDCKGFNGTDPGNSGDLTTGPN